MRLGERLGWEIREMAYGLPPPDPELEARREFVATELVYASDIYEKFDFPPGFDTRRSSLYRPEPGPEERARIRSRIDTFLEEDTPTIISSETS